MMTLSRRSGLLSALTDALILTLGMGGLFFTLSSVFSLEVYPPVLLAGCILCPLGFLAVFSLPRLRFLPLLAAAAGWGWALWRFWEFLCLGEISIRCSVVNTFAIHVPSVTPIHPIADLPTETWTAAATLLSLMAVVPLSALAAWALRGRRMPGLFFWFTFPFLIPALCITQTPAPLPLCALISAWIAALLPSLASRESRNARARLTLMILPCAAALLALLLLLIPVDSYQRPLWAENARDDLTIWISRTFDGPFEGGDGPGGLGGSSLADADGGVDLSQAGPLRYSGRTVLQVTAPDLKGRIYLRGLSGVVYEGNRWEPLPDEAYEGLDHLPLYSSAIPQLMGYQPMNFPAMADRACNPDHDYAQVTIENVGADPGFVYYPYQILTTPEQLGGAAFVHDAWLARAEDVRKHTLYIMPECDPLSGTVLTGEAAEAELNYRNFVSEAYTSLDLPDETLISLSQCLREVFETPETSLPNGMENEYYQRLTSGYSQDSFRQYCLDWANLIADYLGQLAVYDPETPAAPEGSDFVSHFLTESRRGYCMHFASAATLLLRGVGIPARYVSGYVADIENGRASVPDSNAHAWVEIYLGGYGWEPVEVTPAYAGATPGRSISAADPTPTPSTTPTPTPNQSQSPRPTPTPVSTPTPSGTQGEGSGTLLELRWLWIPGAVCAAILLLLLRRKLIHLRRKSLWERRNSNESVIGAYRYLCRLERWGASIDPAVERLAQKARFSQHILSEDERQAAVAAVCRAAGEVDARLSRSRRFAFRYLWCLY